jgi:hypothetical protein
MPDVANPPCQTFLLTAPKGLHFQVTPIGALINFDESVLLTKFKLEI